MIKISEIKFTKFTKNQLFAVLILCAFIAATFKLFILPHILALGSIRRQYLLRTMLLEQRKEEEKKISAMLAEVKKKEGELSVLKKRFLAEEEVNGFLEEVSVLAAQTGNRLLSLRPLQPAQDGFEQEKESGVQIKEGSTNIELTGTFLTLRQFISTLENYSRLLKIGGFNIRSESERGELSVSFVLTFYIEQETS